jgi:hypothetical protein
LRSVDLSGGHWATQQDKNGSALEYEK